MLKIAKKFVGDNKGATAIEYGLIAALLAVGAVAALDNLGGSLGSLFTTVATTINTASAP